MKYVFPVLPCLYLEDDLPIVETIQHAQEIRALKVSSYENIENNIEEETNNSEIDAFDTAFVSNSFYIGQLMSFGQILHDEYPGLRDMSRGEFMPLIFKLPASAEEAQQTLQSIPDLAEPMDEHESDRHDFYKVQLENYDIFATTVEILRDNRTDMLKKDTFAFMAEIVILDTLMTRKRHRDNEP